MFQNHQPGSATRRMTFRQSETAPRIQAEQPALPAVPVMVLPDSRIASAHRPGSLHQETCPGVKRSRIADRPDENRPMPRALPLPDKIPGHCYDAKMMQIENLMNITGP
jgi:hypothetical protein